MILITNDVDNATKGFITDGDTNGSTSVGNLLSTDKTFSTVHGNGSYGVLSQMLGDFEDETVASGFDLKGVENLGEFFVELWS